MKTIERHTSELYYYIWSPVCDGLVIEDVTFFLKHAKAAVVVTFTTLLQSILIISPVTRCAATWPLELELKFVLSNNVRMSTPLRLLKCILRDHNSSNCTHSGNVCCCTYMINNDSDTFRSFSRLYLTLFRHRTCTYLHGRADRCLVLVSNGQVAALSDWAYML